MTNYVIDAKTWRCGGLEGHGYRNVLGYGGTCLLNEEGYMCCLGQFAKQAGVASSKLFERTQPKSIGTIYDPLFVSEPYLGNTHLADELIEINDNPYTTPLQKIDLIRSKLEKHGHTLTVLGEETLW